MRCRLGKKHPLINDNLPVLEKHPIACMRSIENGLLVEKFQLEYDQLP